MRREILIQTIDPPSNVVGTLTSDEEPSPRDLPPKFKFKASPEAQYNESGAGGGSRDYEGNRRVLRLLLRDGIGPAEQPTGDLPMTSKKIA
jgi:hypothetical protein